MIVISTEQIRKTAKGWKYSKVNTAMVWHWDGKEEKACKRTLVITKSAKIKYAQKKLIFAWSIFKYRANASKGILQLSV